jgi:hypothetical protein
MRKGRPGEMRNRKSLVVIGLFILMIFSLMLTVEAAHAAVFYGVVVGNEVKSIQVRGDDGRVSVFWIGRHTRLTTRRPSRGDRVKIHYVKDHLDRNAATRITILGR